MVTPSGGSAIGALTEMFDHRALNHEAGRGIDGFGRAMAFLDRAAGRADEKLGTAVIMGMGAADKGIEASTLCTRPAVMRKSRAR